MKQLVVLLVAIAVISALVLGGCAAQPAPAPKPTPTPAPAPAPAAVIQLKFAHQNPPQGRTTVKFLDPFGKQIEDVTKGRVKVTMYPAESLAKAKEVVEATVGGITDITWSNIGYYTGRYPLTGVMALPFMSLASGKIDGKVRSGGAVNSHILQELYETLPELQAEYKDVKVLYLQCTDPYLLFTSKKPVRNANDVKGLKVRELGGYPSDMWKAFGASPSNLAMPDTYEALDNGVMDGANLPWAAMATFKFYEVVKYYTDVATAASPQFVIMNLEKWNSLPPDIQQAITSISGIKGAEFAGDTGWGFEVKDELIAQAQKANRPLEKVDLDPGEYDRWKDIAGKPVWDKWVVDMKAKGLNGQKVLDATQALLKKYSP
jgi:TRAP-type C4-dicarboxylate transport system substrate-binding protein